MDNSSYDRFMKSHLEVDEIVMYFEYCSTLSGNGKLRTHLHKSFFKINIESLYIRKLFGA